MVPSAIGGGGGTKCNRGGGGGTKCRRLSSTLCIAGAQVDHIFFPKTVTKF